MEINSHMVIPFAVILQFNDQGAATHLHIMDQSDILMIRVFHAGLFVISGDHLDVV